MKTNYRACILGIFIFGVFSYDLLAQNYDMGVIKGNQGCGGRPEYTVYIDNEDTNNTNSRKGWLGGITSDRNTTLRFCAVNSGDFFSVEGGPYMLISLKTGSCSRGYMVQRMVDCENSNPRCHSNIPGAIYNLVSRDVALTFCYFAADSRSFNVFPFYTFSYGVFAPPTFSGAISVGELFMDDQQADITGDNRNYWCDLIPGDEGCSGLSDHRNYYEILLGGHNTGMRWIRAR